MRQYKIKYFDCFRVQKEFHSANLDEPFFKHWHSKLSKDPITNWHISATTCIRHLVEHKDAPKWLRDIYSNHPRYDRRIAALLTNSGKYKFDNIDKILSDRSNVLRINFFYSVLYDLKNGIALQPEHLSKILEIPSTAPSLKASLRLAIIEKTAALVHPDPIIRTLAKIFYNSTEEQRLLLLKSINMQYSSLSY